MAEVVTSPPAASRSPARSRRRPRFLVAYAVLAALLGAAAAALALLVTARSEEPPVTPRTAGWSLWRPTAGGVEGAEQIANFVSRRYRLPSGRQLVAVKAGPLALENVRISAVAIQTPETGDPDIRVTGVENGVAYFMCGLGTRCAISEGKPSQQRGRLVRREALELALYTFKYLRGVDTVVVFMPPPGRSETSFVAYFPRGDLVDELSRPLRATLPEANAPQAAEIGIAEALLVDNLTVRRVYGFGFQQFQDGTLLLVLSPPRGGD